MTSIVLSRVSAFGMMLSFVWMVFLRGGSIVLGLLMSMLVARAFGATQISDAFFLARRLAFETAGAMNYITSNAFVPAFCEAAQHQGPKAARRLLGRFVLMAAAIGAACTALAWGASGAIVGAIGGNLSEGNLALGAELLRIMSLVFPPVLVLAVLGGALNALRLFGGTEFARLLPKLFVTMVLLTLVPPAGVSMLAWGLTAGCYLGCLLLAITWFRNRQAVVSISSGPPQREREKGGIGGRLMALALLQVYASASLWIDSFTVLRLAPGALAITEFGQRLADLAPGVITTSLMAMAYAEFSRTLTAGHAEQLPSLAARVFRLILLLILPLLAFEVVFADRIVSALLLHGSFTKADAEITADMMRLSTIPVVTNALTYIAVNLIVLLTIKRKIIMLSIFLLSGIVVRVILMLGLTELLGIYGVPLAASASSVFVLTLYLSRLPDCRRELFRLQFLRSLAPILVATLAAAAAWLCMMAFIPPMPAVWLELGLLGIIAAAGGGLYLGLCRCFGLPEIGVALDLVQRKNLRRE